MCSIPKSEVLRYLGYTNQEISEELDMKIDKIITLAEKEASPKSVHMISDIAFTENKIRLTGTDIVLHGKSIKEYLKGAVKCITLACTLGVGFESALLRIQQISITDSLIFDAAGNALIESYADSEEAKLLEQYKNMGLHSKYRFSPGYGDLPLELQHDILSALGCERKIGLTATDSNILIPRKSITAFMGIFNTPQSKPQSKCENCSAKDFCKMRKDGVSCD